MGCSARASRLGWLLGLAIAAAGAAPAPAPAALIGERRADYAWHSFLGGGAADSARAVAVDARGDVVVTGRSMQGWLGPAGQAPLRGHSGGGAWNLFVAKLSREGEYLWHTFHGPDAGSFDSVTGDAVAVDRSGNVLVAGSSAVEWAGPGGEPPRHAHSGGLDVVVFKLGADGRYLWHTFFGSDQYDSAHGVAVDAFGGVVVSGESDRSWRGPRGARPLHPHAGGGAKDLFVAKLTAGGHHLWHAFYGGEGENDAEAAVAVDRRGNVVVAAESSAAWRGPGGRPPLRPHAGDSDIAVLKLTSRGRYLWHTFAGSHDVDGAAGVAVDRSGEIVVAGHSRAAWTGPAGEPPRNAHQGSFDIAVLKLSSGGAYRWHSFFGSGHSEFAAAVAVDARGHAVVAGRSARDWSVAGSGDPLRHHADNVDDDLTVVRLAPDGTCLWHAFHGGATGAEVARDFAEGVAVDRGGNVVVVGASRTSWLGPAGQAPLDPHTGGGTDCAVVLKLLQEPMVTSFSGAPNDGRVLESARDSGEGGRLGREGRYLLVGDDGRDLQRVEGLEPRPESTGGFDLSFSADGKASLDFGANDTARAVAVQRDGKIVAVGSMQVGAADSDFAIARFNRDGTPDTTFNGTGKVTVAFNLGGTNSDQATTVAIDALGRIVVGGFATSAAGDFDFAVCRLTSAGLLDATFDGDGKQTVSFNLGQQNQDQANGLALQTDGKIVMAGTVQRTIAGDTDFGVVRLRADGSPDTQFSADGKAQVFFDVGGTNADTASAVAIQPDGMIVVAGTAATAADFEFAVARILANGSTDSSFGVNGRQRVSFGAGSDFGNAVAIQRDGRIVLVGSATGPTSVDFGVARLSSNGAVDATFDGDGLVLVPFDLGSTNADIARAVTVHDGKILVAGQVARAVAPDTDMGVARLNANGSLDTTFDGDGKRVVFFDLGGTNVDDVGGIALSADGIVVAGSAATATGFDFALTRLIRDQWVIVSADEGGPPTVKIFTPTGTFLKSFNAFPASFRGGVRVAAGDINGDQVPDIVCAPGPGMAPQVKIFDGRTFTLIRSIMAFAPGFKGGVNVAVADVQGDATLELITAPGAGIAPVVKIFNPRNKSLIGTFQAYPAGFTKGVRVAAGDTDGNALREIIVAPQSGNPAVRIFDAAGTQIRAIRAFPTTFTGGVFIAAGSIDASGRQDIVIAPGPGGGASVRVFEGSTGALLQQPAVYSAGFNRGIRVATVNADGDALADMILAPGRLAAPTVKIRGGNGLDIASFDAFSAGMTAGLFVVGVAR